MVHTLLSLVLSLSVFLGGGCEWTSSDNQAGISADSQHSGQFSTTKTPDQIDDLPLLVDPQISIAVCEADLVLHLQPAPAPLAERSAHPIRAPPSTALS